MAFAGRAFPFIHKAFAQGVQRDAHEVEHSRDSEKDGGQADRYEDDVKHETIIALKVAIL